MTLAAVFMCCVKMHSCCSEPFPFQLQPSCDRGSVHCFAGFYSAVHGGFAASEHPCDARNGALYEENLSVTEYAQYVRALVHGKAPDDMVTATFSGDNQLIDLKIKPEAVDPDDIDMLQDLVIAAVKDGMKQVNDATQQKLGKYTQGMGL